MMQTEEKVKTTTTGGRKRAHLVKFFLNNEEYEKLCNPTCYGTDRRWANHLYPVFLTESYVKSKYISAEMFLHLF